MRPKKERSVRCSREERVFVPHKDLSSEAEYIQLTLDELEAMRLTHIKGLYQEQAAEEMGVHRSTLSRILDSGYKKMTEALVNIKGIKVEGGCCKFKER